MYLEHPIDDILNVFGLWYACTLKSLKIFQHDQKMSVWKGEIPKRGGRGKFPKYSLNFFSMHTLVYLYLCVWDSLLTIFWMDLVLVYLYLIFLHLGICEFVNLGHPVDDILNGFGISLRLPVSPFCQSCGFYLRIYCSLIELTCSYIFSCLFLSLYLLLYICFFTFEIALSFILWSLFASFYLNLYIWALWSFDAFKFELTFSFLYVSLFWNTKQFMYLSLSKFYIFILISTYAKTSILMSSFRSFRSSAPCKMHLSPFPKWGFAILALPGHIYCILKWRDASLNTCSFHFSNSIGPLSLPSNFLMISWH